MWLDSGFFFDHLPHTPYAPAIHNQMHYFCVLCLFFLWSVPFRMMFPSVSPSCWPQFLLLQDSVLAALGSFPSHWHTHPAPFSPIKYIQSWIDDAPLVLFMLYVNLQHILFWTHSFSKYLLSINTMQALNWTPYKAVLALHCQYLL